MDKKISQLTELAQADIATGDLAAIVDVSDTTDAASGTTKKFTWASLRGAIATYLASLAQTLTNKTIDADNNTISNLALGDEVTGASTDLTDTADITYNADTDASEKGWVIDEDNMASDSDTKVPTQQSVKAYADTKLANVVEDTTPQLGGDLDAQDNNVTGAGSISFTQELDNGSKSTNFSIDFSTDQKQVVTLTANTMTLTLDTTNVGVGNYILRIVNGGLATLTWASETGSILWPGGTEPSLTSSGEDIISLYFNGTNWYAQAALDFS